VELLVGVWSGTCSAVHIASREHERRTQARPLLVRDDDISLSSLLVML
jgi:hypothetical protein